MTDLRNSLALGLLLSITTTAVLAQERPKNIEDFDGTAGWSVIASDQVSGALRETEGLEGRALCLDYDFNDVSGYVGLQRDLPIDYPADYHFSLQLRGNVPANDLQFKLVDASGDNVWWVSKPTCDPDTSMVMEVASGAQPTFGFEQNLPDFTWPGSIHLKGGVRVPR